MQKIVFISDLHLSHTSVAANELFYKMLNNWRNEIDSLYILGDFFDYWIDDNDDHEFARTMIVHLYQFASVVPTYFIKGNHDFMVGKKFAKLTNIKILNDVHIIAVGNKTPIQILLTHGDIFCSLDYNYQLMKKILRNPILLNLLSLLPLNIKYKIKELLEHYSHKTKINTNAKIKNEASLKKYNHQFIYQIVDNTVVNIANKHYVSHVIHGHTHRPGNYRIKLNDINKNYITRLELPNWDKNNIGKYMLLTINDDKHSFDFIDHQSQKVFT